MSNRNENAGTSGTGDLTFDEALTRLEQVVRRLESGDLKLEDALAAFQEGMRLSNLCEARLNQVEQQIRELVEGPDGTPEERPANLPELEDAG